MTDSTRQPGDLQVWWIPQVPGKPFTVDISTTGHEGVLEAARIMDVLQRYDAFQYEERIKPDYCNAGGLRIWGTDLDDDENEVPGWEDWYDEETGIEEPQEYAELAADPLNQPATSLDVSDRAYRVLRSLSGYTIKDVVKDGILPFLKMRNVGDKTVAEIAFAIKAKGIDPIESGFLSRGGGVYRAYQKMLAAPQER